MQILSMKNKNFCGDNSSYKISQTLASLQSAEHCCGLHLNSLGNFAARLEWLDMCHNNST